ncbi:hypothetical protein ABW20_dc0100697 [Dactylellina cionopaga]|nr:hypothetical protein ABW20_dc0100697 [Dactylellina cionopaga]
MLVVLVTAACLLIASYYARSSSTRPGGRASHTVGSTDTPASEIDGNNLYYGGQEWPQYEARFNFRLSYLYGPVVIIKFKSTTFLARATRWLNDWLYPGQQNNRTTILINSLSGNEAGLKRLLGSCASRALSITAGKYLSRGRRIVLQPDGPDWRRHRRAFVSLLKKEKLKSRCTKALRFEAMTMVLRLAEPCDVASTSSNSLVLDEVSRFTASSVLQITYGRRALTPDDPILKDLKIVSENIAGAFAPGKYWVEKFPLLDIFPSVVSPWKWKLNADHRFEASVFRGLLHGVEEKLKINPVESREFIDDSLRSPYVDGAIPVEECGAAELLRNQENLQLDRDDIAYVAAGIFEAGTETTAMTINTFLLAAVCYPEMVKQAQAELDQRCIKKNRLGDTVVPTFEDLQHMPYLGAIVKESLRLTPTGSSGVGHTPSRAGSQPLGWKSADGSNETTMSVPSEATVLANTYGLHHDSTQFPDPWHFKPERWSPSAEVLSSKALSYSLDYSHANFAFGFGRRICPGAGLASYSLSISIALLLLCFDFELTEKAHMHCTEMEKQQYGECDKWYALFSDPRGRAALEREQVMRKQCEGERDRIGRVLIDAYIVFKLSRSQLAECIRLAPRKQDHGLRAVRETLRVVLSL